MQIHLKELRVLPGLLMTVFAMQLAFDFNSVDMSMASYAMLALMLMAASCSFFLILRQRTINFMDLLYIIFSVTLLASSLFNGTDTKQLVYLCTSFLLLRFLFNYYQEHLNPLIIGMAVGFSLATVAQIHQLITHPDLWVVGGDSIDTGYILGGNYNQIGVRLLMTILLNLLCIRISRWFFLLLIPIILACLAIPIMVGSMTSATGIILFLLLCLIPSKPLRRMSYYVLLIAVALFQFFVCFSGKGIEDNDFMIWFIEEVLGKDITFTGRTHMWDSALSVIADSPIWGYGYPDNDWYVTKMTHFAIGPHNIMLAVLIYGGIIAFALYVCFLFVSLFRALSIRDYWADCTIIGISVFSLMMLMETSPLPLVFTFFILAEYYPQLHHQYTPLPESAAHATL